MSNYNLILNERQVIKSGAKMRQIIIFFLYRGPSDPR